MAQNEPMRLVLLVAALSAACAAQAQVKPMVVRPPASADDRDDRERDWRERHRQEHRSAAKTTPATKMTRPASKPPAGSSPPLMVVRPAEPPTTPPGKAIEMQRQMEEQRRLRHGERR
jgi:hypothetical protein